MIRFFKAALGLAALAGSCLLPAQAAGANTLHVLLTASEAGLDPALASDLSSLSLLENIFDPMLRYDYLARPVVLRPNTLRAMPRIDNQGKTYLFQIQPGTFFTPDPAFHGMPREVTAQDYVYSLKRLYDPGLKSPWLFLFDGKIVGDAALQAPARFSYDTEIAGLRAQDRYTLRIELKAADPNFLFYFAMPATGVVAREVAEAYPGQLGNHPVGSGPFLVEQWQHSAHLVLLANPDFRSTVFHADAASAAAAPALAAQLEGRRLPLLQRIDIRIVEPPQARVLGFLQGQFDYLEQVPETLIEMLETAGALKPELRQRGIVLSRFSVLQTYYLWLNMADPVLGGYTPQQVALRRAIALSYNAETDIGLLKNGLALAAQSPLPPGVEGYDAAYRSPVGYDPVLARALLDRFGYRMQADGWRSRPNGQPLTLVMHTETGAAARLRDELWLKNLTAIGLHIVFKSDKKSEIIKASRLGMVQMNETNWIADFPAGDNFLQLLYGPNSGRANYARFNLPAYNSRYEAARLLPDGPPRRALYGEMAQLIHAYTPWVLLTHPVAIDVRQPWLKNYLRHPVELTAWRYLELDASPH